MSALTHESGATLRQHGPHLGCEPAIPLLEQALTFYGQLGFQTTYHDEAFAIVERDDVAPHLNYSPDPPKGHSVCWIGVNNIDTLYQQYLPTNAIQSPLEAKPWGLKEFCVRDPFLGISSSLLNVFLKVRPVPNRENDRKAKPTSRLLPPFEKRCMLDQGSSAVSSEEMKPEASASYPLANRYSP